MKKSKAVIATAMIFCAAANFTACVYGPPQADRSVDYSSKDEASDASETEETDLTEETEEDEEEK